MEIWGFVIDSSKSKASIDSLYMNQSPILAFHFYICPEQLDGLSINVMIIILAWLLWHVEFEARPIIVLSLISRNDDNEQVGEQTK